MKRQKKEEFVSLGHGRVWTVLSGLGADWKVACRERVVAAIGFYPVGNEESWAGE